MKYVCLCWIVLLAALITACNNSGKRVEPATNKDTATLQIPTDTAAEKEILATIGTEVLIALKAKDYRAFAVYFHPKMGVLFSPYGFIDKKSKKLNKSEFLKIVEEQGSINWGNYDGTGEPIILSPQAYLQKFVYNADYLNAEKTSLNKIIGKGNSPNNLSEIFPNRPFLEYHFSGFDKQYNGLDWTSLRLVFEQYQSSYFLVAVIHDQWTI